MAKRRPRRLRRKALVLGLFLLLLLLLELNRFLPGVWKSTGDTHGTREHAASVVGDSGDTQQPAEDGETSGMQAPPPGRPPPEIPRGGAVIELRLADGTSVDEWSFGSGESGSLGTVDDPQARKSLAMNAVEQPLRARVGNREVRHYPSAVGAPRGHWIIVIPDGAVRPGRIKDRLTLRAFRNDEPISGDTVDIRTVAKDAKTVPLVDGAATLTGIRTLAKAALEKQGADVWFHPRGGDVEIRVPPPAASPPVVAHTAEGLGYVARTGLPPELPPTRTITVTGDIGGRVAVAHFKQAIPEGRGETRALTSIGMPTGTGGIELVVPRGEPVMIVAAGGGGAPGVLELPGSDHDETVEMPLEEGRSLDMRVRAADGTPIWKASVIAEVAPDVTVEGLTDEDGRLRLTQLPHGTVAVFVERHLHAPVGLLIDEDQTTAQCALGPGHTLNLAVSDANGVPIDGVRVELEPERGAPRVAWPAVPAVVVKGGKAKVRQDHGAPRGQPGADRTLEGRCHVDDLGGRAYRVRLYHPDYAPQTIRGVEPGGPKQSRTYFVTLLRKADK